MENKVYLVFGIMLAGAYFLGRDHSPERVVVKTQTVYVDKIVEVEKKVEDTVTLERIKVKANGETLTIRKIQSKAKTETKKDQVTASQSNASQVVENRKDKTTVLLNLDLNRNLGVSVSRPVLGPLTIGLFGFFDGRVGASVGIQF